MVTRVGGRLFAFILLVQGSVEYVSSTGEHPAQLRNDITSPGGTTAAALYEMERGNFRTVIADSVWAAYRRSLEMGGKNSQVGPGRSQSARGPVHVRKSQFDATDPLDG